MKFYSEKNNLILVSDVASANTEVSSVVGHIREFITRAFPKKYFKRTRIDTTETFLDQNRNILYNKNLDKIEYPSLIITPEIMLENPFDVKRLLGRSGTNVMLYRDLKTHYPCLARDPKGRFSIYYTFDPITVNVNFQIIVNKYAQAINAAFNVRSKFYDELFKYLNDQPINIELPKTFVKILGQIEGKLDINDSEIQQAQDVKDIELFLSAISKSDHRIVLKKDLSTSKYGFFFAENQDLLFTITDLDFPSQVTRDSGNEGEYTITFKVQTTFNLINSFILSVDKKLFKPLMSNHVLINELENGGELTGDGFYQINIDPKLILDYKDTIYFKDQNGDKLINPHGEEIIGQNIVHQTFTFDGRQTIDKIDLSKILQPDLLRIHSFAKEQNYDLTNLLYAVVNFKQSKDISYSIDYANLLITFSEPINSEFVLNVYLNRNDFTVLETAMSKNEFFFSQNAMTTISVNYVDEDDRIVPHKIRVYNFKNLKDQYSDDLDKSFRICTIYGIGYIGLVREDSPLASKIKICIGYDKYNHPIIRCLELVQKESK